MKNVLRFLVVLFFGVICCLVAYILLTSDFNDNRNNEVISEDNKLKELVNFQVIPNYNVDGSEFFSINDKRIILDNPMAEVGDIAVFNDFILYNVNYIDYTELFISDFNGNILKKFGTNDLNGIYRGKYTVKDNYIYITSDNLGQDDEASVCNLKNSGVNKEVVSTYKLEYLGNNSFSELVLDDSILSDDYINNNHIECFR